jgi:hypothetical protein
MSFDTLCLICIGSLAVVGYVTCLRLIWILGKLEDRINKTIEEIKKHEGI